MPVLDIQRSRVSYKISFSAVENRIVKSARSVGLIKHDGLICFNVFDLLEFTCAPDHKQGIDFPGATCSEYKPVINGTLKSTCWHRLLHLSLATVIDEYFSSYAE